MEKKRFAAFTNFKEKYKEGFMMKKKLLSLLILAVMLVGVFVPGKSYAYFQHDHSSTNGNVLWYQWTQHPFPVQLGYKAKNQTYSFGQKIPADAVAAAVTQISKAFDVNCYSYKQYFVNNLYKCGMTGLPYKQEDTTNSKPLWAVCTDLVKVYLRDYLGYNLGETESLWDDDRLFKNFADARHLPGILAKSSFGSHKAYLVKTEDDSGQTDGYWYPYFSTDEAFRNYLVSEQNAGRLHIGAIFFWSCSAEQLKTNSDSIQHVSIYVGNGRVLEATPTRGISVNLATKGSGYGKTGMCKFWINIDEELPKDGNLEITKASANSAATNGNACYELSGAQYKLLDSTGKQVGDIMTTNANGFASKTKIPAGSYTLVEVAPSKGFLLNTTETAVTIKGGETTRLNGVGCLKETPLNDPIGMLVQKLDKDTNEAAPRGGASLAGGEFTVKYYNVVTDDVTGLTPTRTWVFLTDEDGQAVLSSDYLKPGSADLYIINGHAGVPIGTLTIQETKAPDGYIADPKVTLFKIESNESGTDTVSTLNEYTLPNEVIEGYIEVVKLQRDFGPNGEIPEEDANAAATPEAGIKFDVYSSAGTKVTTIETGTDGKAKTSILPYDTYTLKQVNSPFGIGAVPDFQVELKEEGNTYSVTKYNDVQYGRLKVIKVESDGTVITKAGITFELRDADGNLIVVDGQSQFATDENGVMMFPRGLRYGTYKLKELSTVEPFILDTTEKTVTIDSTSLDGAGLLTFNFVNNESRGKLELHKKGKALTGVTSQTQAGYEVKAPQFTEQYLAGAEFDLLAADEIVYRGEKIYDKDDVVRHIVTTSTDKSVEDNLRFGSYVLTETVVPDGYVKAADIPLVFTYDNTKAVITLEANAMNTLRSTAISLVKYGEKMTVTVDDNDVSTVTFTEEPMAGFTFGLFANQDFKNQSGTVIINKNDMVAAAVSDSEGNISFSGEYPVGKYYLKELAAPDRYVISEAKHEIDTSNSAGTGVITVDVGRVNNYLDKAYAQIVKKDAESGDVLRIAGFKFQIYDKNDTLIETVQTDQTGIAKLNVPLRHDWVYTVKEIAVPKGFVRNTASATLEIVDSSLEGDLYTAAFQNVRTKGKISVLKKGEMIVGFTEDEVTGPTLYTPSIDLSQGEPSEDEGEKEPLFILRTPIIEERYMAGAKFELRAAEDIYYNREKVVSANELIATLETNSEGAASATGLYLGKYTLKEVYAPDGYVLDETVHEIELTYKNDQMTVVEETVSPANALRTVEITLQKKAETLGTVQDSDGNVTIEYTTIPTAGFVFGLFNKEEIAINGSDETIPADSVIAIAVSHGDGTVNVKFTEKVPYGEYYVKEVMTKPKYIIDTTVFEFDNKVDDATAPVAYVSLEEPITNYYIKKPIVINKTDITGEKGLPGATLELEDENGTVIYRAVTDDSGALDEIDLIPGTYTLREVFAPNGYSLSSEEVVFTLTEDKEIIGETTMKDDVTRFQFYKVDESGKPLAGAEFTMYNEKGEVYAVSYSDEKGVVTFENMIVGSYIIEETLAPEHYQLCEDTLSLVVTERWMNDMSYTDGGELMYSLMNHKIIKTGVGLSGTATAGIVIGAIALIGLAGAGVYVAKKKKKNV